MIFSYIVPVYNVEDIDLIQCVESILSQTIKDMEIIIVNDGSNESNARICEQYAKNNDLVHVIHQSNMGLAAARNSGIKAAKGDWIVHVDGDDWVDSNLSEILLQKISKYVDIIIFSYKTCYEYKTTTHELLNKNAFDINYSILQKELIKASLLDSTSFNYLAINTSWAKAFNRKFVIDNNLEFDNNLRRSQDVIYNLYAFNAARKVIFADFSPYNYRVNQKSLSHEYNPKTFERITKTVLAAYCFVNQYPQYEKSVRVFTRKCFLNIIKQDFTNPANKKRYEQRKNEFLSARNLEPYKNVLDEKGTKYRMSECIELYLVRHNQFLLLTSFRRMYEYLKKYTR